jgi:phosphohistidine phosphatase
VARLLVDLNEGPLSVVTSLLVRAVQTAEIVASVTSLGDRSATVETRREMSPSGEAAALVRWLAAEGRKRVMVVGHEPDLSELVGALLVDGSFRRSFDKAMVVGLHVPGSANDSRSRLRFVLDPKALQLDPDKRVDQRPAP